MDEQDKLSKDFDEFIRMAFLPAQDGQIVIINEAGKYDPLMSQIKRPPASKQQIPEHLQVTGPEMFQRRDPVSAFGARGDPPWLNLILEQISKRGF